MACNAIILPVLRNCEQETKLMRASYAMSHDLVKVFEMLTKLALPRPTPFLLFSGKHKTNRFNVYLPELHHYTEI